MRRRSTGHAAQRLGPAENQRPEPPTSPGRSTRPRRAATWRRSRSLWPARTTTPGWSCTRPYGFFLGGSWVGQVGGQAVEVGGGVAQEMLGRLGSPVVEMQAVLPDETDAAVEVDGLVGGVERGHRGQGQGG